MTSPAKSQWLAAGFLLLGLVLSLVLLIRQQSATPSRFEAPDFSVRTLDGKLIQLHQLQGSVVLLNFWATWCPPCREELPSMERLHRRLAPEGLVLIAVSVDEDAANVRSVVDAHSISFLVALDPQMRLPKLFGVTGYPETFVIDSAGRIVRHLVGPQEWDSKELLDFFQTLLREGGSAGVAGTKVDPFGTSLPSKNE